jgi:hypothetical protein
LLVIRIVEVVMTWDVETYEKLVDYGSEEMMKPMPIGFLN